MRYVWDQYEEYFGKDRAGWMTRCAMQFAGPMLRRWDVRTAGRVHYYIANSKNVQERIERIYHRDSEVIYPPVNAEQFQVSARDGGYYLVVSALVPYKRVDLAIDVFNKKGTRLIVVGKGPDEKKLRRLAKPNIEFTGWKSDDEIASLYAGCTALVFPGEEDFGIVPLEAMASGKGVIAYGKGGALETVDEGLSGVFFYTQTADALEEAVSKAELMRFDPENIRARALRFSRVLYKEAMKQFIEKKMETRGWSATSLFA